MSAPTEPRPQDTLAAPEPDVTLDASMAGWSTDASLVGSQAPRASLLPRLSQVGETFRLAAPDGPRYAPIRELGRGGMGEVALVEDRDIGRQVAVKRLLALADGPGTVARFVDEVRTIGRLEHPNIVPIHDVGLDADGRYYFVMKYVEGETLEAVIERLRRAEPQAVAQWTVELRVQVFIGLLRALQYAHRSGFLHRDVKPANVMVGPFGEVVLMDWGVACHLPSRPGGPASPSQSETAAPTSEPTPEPTLSGATPRLSSTQVGALVGTPHYMSPEQARGENHALDARSDLYSACALFYELLGLQPRHAEHKGLMAVLIAVSRAEPPELATMFPSHPAQPDGVPAELGHFLRRGLALEPDDRWQSAAQMIEELQAVSARRCRVQCPVTFTKAVVNDVSRFVDRHHLWGAVAVNVGVVGVLAVVGHALWRLFVGG